MNHFLVAHLVKSTLIETELNFSYTLHHCHRCREKSDSNTSLFYTVTNKQGVG